jgi:hypothetical protein
MRPPLVAFYVGVNDIYSRREWFLQATLPACGCVLFFPLLYFSPGYKIDLGRARIFCLAGVFVWAESLT